jgi:hypothetical protein
LFKTAWSADVSEDDAQDALKSAVEHFAELLRVLDAAITDANRVGDQELVERLARAKAAAEHGDQLVDQLSGILESRQTASDA